MTKIRPGHHVYVPRIGECSVAAVSPDGSFSINPFGRPNDTLVTMPNGVSILPNSAVPLHWDRPVYAQDGRRFIFNKDGYGRTVEHLEPNVGRQMWYGWLGEYAKEGNWYYEDGTPARGETQAVLTNIPPAAKVGDRVIYMTPPEAQPGYLGWEDKPATVIGFRGIAAELQFDDPAIVGGTATLERLHPNYDAPPAVPKLDPARRIVAECRNHKDRVFVVKGPFVYRENTIAGYLDNGTDRDEYSIILVDTIDGKVVPRYAGDNTGSALTFVNKALVETQTERVDTPFGKVDLEMTTTDGVVTDVRLA